MLTVTFIRHGESEDNLKDIWAGWKDAPLSDLGKRQARALGQSFSSTQITHIYTSPLLRAHATAQSVFNLQSEPKPSFTVSPNLREQHFGIAEGNKSVVRAPNNTPVEELWAQKIFPVQHSRQDKFPEGESLDDLARRAEVAVRECILPHVETDNVHVAVASHSLCISELVAALLRLDPGSRRDISSAGLLNTAWTRVEVQLRNGHVGGIDPLNPPPLQVRVTHVNNKDHLSSVAKEPVPLHKGDDGAQAETRAFFGGKIAASDAEKVAA